MNVYEGPIRIETGAYEVMIEYISKSTDHCLNLKKIPIWNILRLNLRIFVFILRFTSFFSTFIIPLLYLRIPRVHIFQSPNHTYQYHHQAPLLYPRLHAKKCVSCIIRILQIQMPIIRCIPLTSLPRLIQNFHYLFRQRPLFAILQI